jgi:hypothetical protein
MGRLQGGAGAAKWRKSLCFDVAWKLLHCSTCRDHSAWNRAFNNPYTGAGMGWLIGVLIVVILVIVILRIA